MTYVLITSAVALGLGLLMPLRWGLWGFAGATAVLFLMLTALNALTGYAGAPLSESLLLFDNSYLSYLGFNLQIGYRGFGLPLFLLAAPLVFRFQRSLRRD